MSLGRSDSPIPDPESPQFGDGFHLVERGGVPLLVAALLDRPGLVHAFTTRLGGDSSGPFASFNLGRGARDPATLANRRRLMRALGLETSVEASQVHGAVVTRVGAADAGSPVPGADGLITDEPGVALAIHAADCAAILLADPDRRAVGAVHAGWRGAAAGVAEEAVRAMRNAFGTRPQGLVAAIGPAIGPCCYEVDGPVLDAFARWPWRDEVMIPAGPQRWRLDIPSALARQLHEAGVRRVAVLGSCTRDHPDLFYSYRRDRTTGRMAGIIALAP